jgi:hypothetical protein
LIGKRKKRGDRVETILTYFTIFVVSRKKNVPVKFLLRDSPRRVKNASFEPAFISGLRMEQKKN